MTDLRFRQGVLWILLSTLFAFPCNADIVDITSLVGDATTLELSKNHEVAVVRDAIAKCRAGKFEEAVPVLTEHAGNNDIGATYVLARLYLEGLGVSKSKEMAIQLLKTNVEGGHAPSMIELGRIKESDSPAEAVQLIKMAAAAGSTLGYLKLGNISENGELGTRANPKLAFTYYEKALKANSPLGMFHVARCYDEGIGVSPNAIESTRMFRQAALAGVPVANAIMARRYFEGKGVESDPVAALGWLTRGAQAGSFESMVLLGQRYENGDAIGQDLNLAGQLYSAAAAKGDPTGCYFLALMYLHGKGTQADPVRAYVLLERAQSFSKAKEQFEKLSKELTAEQLALANKKIAETKAKPKGN